MSTRSLLDNWTQQNAGELLTDGFAGGTASEIAFSADESAFRYEDVLADVVSLECLSLLLHHVVFSDDIVVDADFAYTWDEHSPLALLAEQRVITTKPLLEAKSEWIATREAMEDHLSFCPAVRERHLQNKESYQADGNVVDGMLSQVLWGGAGMLARAHYLKVPYTPHPLRQRLLEQAPVLARPTSADTQLKNFVDGQRLKVFGRIDESGVLAELRLPPALAEILTSAASLEDLIPAALELRDSYRELRGWLSEMQTTLDNEDTRAALSHRKLFESVSRYIDQLSDASTSGDTSVRLGLRWLSVTQNVGSPVNTLQNKLGVRAQINRLILAPAGVAAFDKLVSLLGGNPDVARLRNAFMTTQARV